MAPHSKRTQILALALALGVRPAPLYAEDAPLSAALALYEQGLLSESLQAFEAALRTGGLDRAQLCDTYLHLGILRAGARDGEKAQASFLALLSLEPGAALPPDSSPVVRAPFERARRAVRGPLRARFEAPSEVGAGSSLAGTLQVEEDPAQLVEQVRFTFPDHPDATIEVRAQPPITLSFPPPTVRNPGPLRYRVEALDAYGSLLAEVGSAEAPQVITVVPRPAPPPPPVAERPAPPPAVVVPPPPAEEEQSSVLASPWLWIAVGLLLAGGTVSAVMLTREPDSDRARFSPVEIETR